MSQQRQSIPWSIAVPPEVHCEYCGVKMYEYHANPQVMMEVQLEGPRLLHEKYGLPLRRSVSPDFSTYATGSTLGLEVDFSREHAPSPMGHPISSIEEAVALRVPDDIPRPASSPGCSNTSNT